MNTLVFLRRPLVPAAAAARLSKKEKRRGRDKAGRPHAPASAHGDTAALSGADWERMHDPTTDHHDAASAQADYAEALLSDIESAEVGQREQLRGFSVGLRTVPICLSAGDVSGGAC